MVHGIRIRDGKAEWYRNRWVRGPQRPRRWARQHRPAHSGTFRDRRQHQRDRTRRQDPRADRSAVSPTYELTDELDTVGACDFDGTLTGGYTAHPKRDPETGELHAVSYSMYRGNTVQYSVIGIDGPARRTVDIEVGGQPDDARLLADREARRVLRPAGHVRRRTGGGDDGAARVAAARAAAVVGLDRPGPHPRSRSPRGSRAAEGIRPAVPVLVEPALPRPRRRDAARRRQLPTSAGSTWNPATSSTR